MASIEHDFLPQGFLTLVWTSFRLPGPPSGVHLGCSHCWWTCLPGELNYRRSRAAWTTTLKWSSLQISLVWKKAQRLCCLPHGLLGQGHSVWWCWEGLLLVGGWFLKPEVEEVVKLWFLCSDWEWVHTTLGWDGNSCPWQGCTWRISWVKIWATLASSCCRGRWPWSWWQNRRTRLFRREKKCRCLAWINNDRKLSMSALDLV